MVNWDTKQIVEDILTAYFDSTSYSVDIYQNTEGDSGGSKISNRSYEHELQISNTDDISVEKADITYSSLNKSSQVFINIRSEGNKQEIWEETLSALIQNRKLDSYEWDKIEFDDLSIEDPSFGVHTSTIQVVFIKTSDPIE